MLRKAPEMKSRIERTNHFEAGALHVGSSFVVFQVNQLRLGRVEDGTEDGLGPLRVGERNWKRDKFINEKHKHAVGVNRERTAG